MLSRSFLLSLFLLTSLSSFAVDVLVNTSGFNDPYYNFSINDGTTDFNFTNSGSDRLLTGIEYTFTGNNTSHPFRMYVTDPQGNTTDLVNNLSFRGSQSFTLDTSTDYSTYTKTYVCNAHPSMNGTFNIIPESSSYSLLLGGLALGLAALRRRGSRVN